MTISDYLEEMKKFQENLLIYIEEETNFEDKYKLLKDIFEESKIHEDRHKLKSLLYLVAHISNNHHRTQNFFDKIERILQNFQNDIKKYYTNIDIFNIFKGNKRILLFLIEQKLMIFDEYIVKKIIMDEYVLAKYPQYFSPELQPFIKEKWFPKDVQDKYDQDNSWIFEIKKKVTEDFYEKRKIGENENYICQLIQKDSVDDFIVYINQNNYKLTSIIKPSIYETNPLLIDNQIVPKYSKGNLTLISYAMFYGSIKIIQYLLLNNVELTQSLWPFAIHSQNAEIIHLLEEKGFKPLEKGPFSYINCFNESVKCHHNDIANYIQSSLLGDLDSHDTFIKCINYYNFAFIQNELMDESSFFYICRYDYYLMAAYLLKNNDMDIYINRKYESLIQTKILNRTSYRRDRYFTSRYERKFV